MTTQPMSHDAAGAASNTTARDELAADETLDRIARAREVADTPDDAAAQQAWRQIATLASRLHRQAHAILVAHEGHAATREQREHERRRAQAKEKRG